MDQTVKTFTSEGAGARKWIGRIIMAVILGEAIWSLIVSVMNNLVVPWLGDVMGQSSGLPTSFTQRPYDYPDLFISVLEFCVAGIMAVTLNYFLQGQRPGRVKPVSSAPTPPVEPGTSRSSSRGGCSDDQGHVADRPIGATREAGPIQEGQPLVLLNVVQAIGAGGCCR
jgi:hypothetical protein